MLIAHELFKTFANRPLAHGSGAKVWPAIEIDHREQIDKTVKLALENGGARFKESVDHGRMYYDSFADLDGYQWEIIILADPNHISQ